jgi:hypothetical protein
MLRFALMGTLLFGFTACSKKVDTSEYPSLIQGTWKEIEGGYEGAVVQAKDGKLNMSWVFDEQPIRTTGTYHLKDDNLTVTYKNPRNNNKNETKTFKIKTLTKQELVMLEDGDDNKQDRWVKQ